MPIISFNISQHLKKFLKQMVGSKEYKNNSALMREALVRLMHEKESAIAAQPGNIDVLENMLPKISSSVLITIEKFNSKIEKKINRLEVEYHRSILHKSSYLHKNKKTVMYVVENTMNNIQSFITDLNSIEELLAFRYIINEPEES